MASDIPLSGGESAKPVHNDSDVLKAHTDALRTQSVDCIERSRQLRARSAALSDRIVAILRRGPR